MTEITIVDNEYITLNYMPDKGMLYHTVHKPISGQPLRDALLAGYEAIQKYGVSKWLSDDRKNGPMTQEDREWGNENLNRRAAEIGWKYWALVVPEAVVAAGSMLPTIEALWELGKLRMRVFSNTQEAIEWLDSIDE
jgi:hypothetical protein